MARSVSWLSFNRSSAKITEILGIFFLFELLNFAREDFRIVVDVETPQMLEHLGCGASVSDQHVLAEQTLALLVLEMPKELPGQAAFLSVLSLALASIGSRFGLLDVVLFAPDILQVPLVAITGKFIGDGSVGKAGTGVVRVCVEVTSG